MSLKLALEQLDLGPCHHGDEVFANPEQLPAWAAAVNGGAVDWDAVYAGYESTADWPGASFWQPLADHYPDAKVILTLRETESWWQSYSSTIMAFFRDMLPHCPDVARRTGSAFFVFRGTGAGRVKLRLRWRRTNRILSPPRRASTNSPDAPNASYF
jgi:hypothetical protein